MAAVRVHPGAKNPTHEISLSDGVQKWGLRLAGGPGGLQELPLTPSTLNITGTQSKFGDWEPGLSQIERRTWEGGRGQEDFVDDPTRYYDSQQAWTLTSGKLLPAPQWHFARGVRASYEHLPGDVRWAGLQVSYEQIAQAFTASSDLTSPTQAYFWLRRVGTPGTLTVSIRLDGGGVPGVTVCSGTLAASAMTDGTSQFRRIALSAGTLTSGLTYWVVVSGAAGDNAANHWEVAVDPDTSASKYTNRAPIWDAADFKLYHRIVGVYGAKRKWRFFEYLGGLYAVDQKESGQAARLLLNGGRGKATSASAASLTDSRQSWVIDRYAGAWVKIVSGTGCGQRREISANSGDTLTLAEEWEITPDANSGYVLYGTPWWEDITPASGDQFEAAVTSAAVGQAQVIFAQGQAASLLKMRWNPDSSPPAHEFDQDGSNTADLLLVRSGDGGEMILWKADAAEAVVTYGREEAWGVDTHFVDQLCSQEPDSFLADPSGTRLDVSDGGRGMRVGIAGCPITSLYEQDGALYAFKPDGRYQIGADGSVQRGLVESGLMRSENNGQAVLARGLYAYFSWGGAALMRLYAGRSADALDSVGPDQDAGLPGERRGAIACLAGHTAGILAGVDGQESGYSSVLMLPDGKRGWHEVLRGWEAGLRVGSLFWEESGGERPRLWVSLGGELVYQDWPRNGFNPLQDSGMHYQHEAVLVDSVIDMGAAGLPKFIKEVRILSENLGSGAAVYLDYQTDAQIGSNDWVQAGVCLRSPEESLPVLAGSLRRFRLRLRLACGDARMPPVVHAVVVEGFARTPVKYQWQMRVKLSDCQRELASPGKDHDPDALLDWLKEAAGQARRVQMRSIWAQMDGRAVIVEPPSLTRDSGNNAQGYWGGTATITVREA